MPELPEVETIVRALKIELVGRTITDVEIRLAKLFPSRSDELVGRTITDISRRGKILIWHFDRGFLAIHLKMTGQLIFVGQRTKTNGGDILAPNDQPEKPIIGGHPDKLYGQPLPHRFTHVIIHFKSGTLYFNDLRQFGWLKFLPDEAALKKEVAHFGPEYDWPEFTRGYFKTILNQRPRLKIKQLLLDQKLIAGIGNIYSDEILFDAGVLPGRPAGGLSQPEVARLYRSIPKILKLALRHGGTSSRDYRQLDGSKGDYLRIANVYQRAGKPCRVCQTPIEVTKVAGRSSHFCPICQKWS